MGLAGDEADIAARKEHFGANYFEPKKQPTYCELIWEGMQDPTVIMLIICAVVSAITEFVDVGCEEDDDDKGDDGDGGRRLLSGAEEGESLMDSLYADIFYEAAHGRRLSGCGKSVFLKIVEPAAITLTVALVLNIAA